MPRHKRVYRHKRRYGRYGGFRGFHRVRHSAKIPLEMVIAGASIPFTPPQDGWRSIVDELSSAGSPQDKGKNIIRYLSQGFMGFDPSNPSAFNAFAAINPFDLSSARYTKMLLYAGLISMVRKRIVHLPMKKIPILGRYIS
jgi:hypothetical protein